MKPTPAYSCCPCLCHKSKRTTLSYPHDRFPQDIGFPPGETPALQPSRPDPRPGNHQPRYPATAARTVARLGAMTTNHSEQRVRNDSLDVGEITVSLASLPSPTIEVDTPDESNADPCLDRRM